MGKLQEIAGRLIRDIKEMIPAMIAILIYYFLVHMIYDAFCPFLIMTGIPCAGCGLTRAFLFLITGQVQRAFYIQPMVFLVLAFGLYCAYFRYIKGTRIKGFSVVLALLILLMLGFYVVRMYQYFPGRVPYVYQKKNLLGTWIPGYKEWVLRILGNR